MGVHNGVRAMMDWENVHVGAMMERENVHALFNGIAQTIYTCKLGDSAGLTSHGVIRRTFR